MTLSFRSRLILITVVLLIASVTAVALLVTYTARNQFETTNAEQTATLVSQFHQEFANSAEAITNIVSEIAASDAVQRLAIQAAQADDISPFVHEAEGIAATRHLDYLEFVKEDGTVLSSAHWPARFGYKELWVAEEPPKNNAAVLRSMETASGNALALVAVQKTGHMYVVGGKRLDTAFLRSLSLSPEMRVLLYSFADDRVLSNTSSSEALNVDLLRPLLARVREQRAESTGQVQWTSDAASRETLDVIPLENGAGRIAAALIVGASQRSQIELERHIRNAALLVALLAIIAGSGFSWFLARRVSGPVEELAEVARAVAAGDWTARAEVTSQDEIGRLAEAFNHMTNELITQRERLVQTERVAAWRELARRLAHELKNPLFPLQITVENMLRARADAPQMFDEVFEESTQTLLAEIANLKSIIGRFSDFSKMPAPQLQPVDLNALVRDVLQLFHAQLNRSPATHVQTEVHLDESLPRIQADPLLLRRAIENLVLNALDTMPDGGKLTFRTAADPPFASLEISDTGAGLTPEECDRLFTPYYTTKQYGTGLGLAIVQSVVSDHGGRVSVSSGKGVGTTFRIELPIASAQQAHA